MSVWKHVLGGGVSDRGRRRGPNEVTQVQYTLSAIEPGSVRVVRGDGSSAAAQHLLTGVQLPGPGQDHPA